ncbi:MAG: thioredoxin domain-containing protein [Thermogutta sp.]
MRNQLSRRACKAGQLAVKKPMSLLLGMTICLSTCVIPIKAESRDTWENQTVLLDFTASWCGPCQRMAPIVEQLMQMGYPVRKIDIDREPALAKRFAIQAVPTFVMLINGQEVKRIVGGASLDDLVTLCRLAPRSDSAAVPATIMTSTATSAIGHPQLAQAQGTSPSRGTGTPQTRLLEAIPPLDENCRFAGASEQDLIAVTVRIRIDDPQGRSTGSGTIIDARGGEALIVTCGHLFRDSRGKTPVLVDLFGPKPAQGIPAQLIYYDDRLDIGFLSIRPKSPVIVARVASPGYPLGVGDPIYSVGCSESQPPTVWNGKITAIDKYLGPSNIEASRAPLVGRSGGGLFSNEGFLIGVCNAADPPLNEGIYLALREIHRSLDQLNLAFVYRWDTSAARPAENFEPAQPTQFLTSQQASAKDTSSRIETSLNSSSVGRGNAITSSTPQSMPLSPTGLRVTPEDLTLASGLPLPIPSPATAEERPHASVSEFTEQQDHGLLPPVVPVALSHRSVLSPEEQATLEEVLRRQASGRNVVCVIQATEQDVSKSEIIIIRNPSPQLLLSLNQPGVITVSPGELARANVREAPLDPFSSRLGQTANSWVSAANPPGSAPRLGGDGGLSMQPVATSSPGASARAVRDMPLVLPATIMAMPSPSAAGH